MTPVNPREQLIGLGAEKLADALWIYPPGATRPGNWLSYYYPLRRIASGILRQN